MSLASAQNKISYDISVSTTVFLFPYKYWESSDLVITKENQTTGLLTDLIIGTDYSIVAVNGDPVNGASITLVLAVDDHIVVIERVVPLSSEAAFTIGDGIPPESLNEALDKAAAQTQQLDEQIGRQIIFPITDPAGLTYELPAVSARISKVISFDTLGSLTVLQLAATGSFAANTLAGIDITDNIASAKVDDVAVEFDVLGNISIKDLGITASLLAADSVTTTKILNSNVTLAKLANIADQTVLSNLSGGAVAPIAVPLVGATGLLLDEDAMGTDSATKGATQQSIKAYVDAHGIVQVANVQDGAKQYTATATVIPNDDTIPQNTEGIEVMTLAFTPTNATSKLKIEVVAHHANNGAHLITALFKDSVADALACGYEQAGAADPTCQSFTHYMTAGVATEITFKVRVGGNGAIVTFNGDNNDAALYGGSLASSITITEIKA